MNFVAFREIISNFLIILDFVEKKNKIKYFILQVHIFFSSILETLSIFSIIPLIQSFDKNSNNVLLNYLKNFFDERFLSTTSLIIFFCTFLILSNLYLILIKKKIIDFGYTLMLDLQKKLFKKIIHNKYEFFINKDISHFNNLILHETQRVKGGFIESSLFIFSQILLVTFTLVGLIIYDFKVTMLIILTLLVFYFVYLLLVSNKILNVSKLNTKFKKETIKYLNDIFSVIKTLVFKRNKIKFYEKLENILIQNYKANRFEQIIGTIIKNSFEIYFLIIVIFFIFLTKNSIQMSSLLSYSVFAFAAYKIIPSFHLIYSQLIAFLGSSNPLKLIVSELTNKKLYSEVNKEYPSLNQLELNNVSFSYDKNKNVLNNVNYKLIHNEIIGICGKSGSGKTTFIDLISGLIDPGSGKILINDKEFDNASEILIYNSAYCSQKTILIDDTIKNNICLETNDNTNEDLLHEAIKIAELEEFIQNCKNGINTIIGEDGIRVSGGEAQRLNIARTFYLNRKLIFLDESLNNLDMVSSKKILDNMSQSKETRTIFFITHDLRLLSGLEKILVFNDGNIVQSGSFSELKKTSSLFLELLSNEN